MAVRHRSSRRCRNCPEAIDGLPEMSAASKTTTYEGEGDGLWKAALVGYASGVAVPLCRPGRSG